MFIDIAMRCGRYVYEGLMQYGMVMTGFPGYDVGEHHPERVAADVPMSAAERQLWEDLSDLW